MKTVEQMAKEAGAIVENWLTQPPNPGLFYFDPQGLERFAALVRAQVLAECVAIVHNEAPGRVKDAYDEGYDNAIDDCQKAISKAINAGPFELPV